MAFMEDKEHKAIMATIKIVKDLVQARMNHKVTTLTTLQEQPITSLPDSIRIKREEEASRIRAVISEQSDIIELLNALFPDE
jgi:hypothetical protein